MRGGFPNRCIYDTLDEFIDEYSSISSEQAKYGECSWGIDFTYKNKEYRMARQQMMDDEFNNHLLEIFKKTKGLYQVVLVNEEQPENELTKHGYHFIGVFEDIYDLLENCFIEDVPFKNIIMDEENTIIYGKD